MRLNLLEQNAKERANMGPEWEVYLWESFPGGARRLYSQLTGAVAPRIAKGPRKGQRNWKKMDKATVRAIVITPAEQTAYEMAWEASTGKCSRCVGEGNVPHSWSKAEGSKSKPCGACNGTGAAVVAEVASC